MSLPQRKKTAEEIAKLRESLGIGGFPAAEPPAGENAPVPAAEPVTVPVAAPAPVAEPALAVPAAQIAPQVPAAEFPFRIAPVSPAVVESPKNPDPVSLPVMEVREPKAVNPLKSSEPAPVLPVVPKAPAGVPILPQASPPATKAPKIVRSLKKSEQRPLAAVHAPPKDSSLPIHRHSDQELGEIRRREMLAHSINAAPPPVLEAHPVLYAPGYLLILGSAVGIRFYDVDRMIPAACVVLALCVATFIFVKKPLSRHHAAFIAVMSLFVVVFGALHYFPQLQHGT